MLEPKKSHKADLEHLRPWMFAGAFASVVLVAYLAMEVRFSDFGSFFDSDDEEIAIDLDLIQKDDRDLIAAAEKEDTKDAERINKVDEEQAEKEPLLEILKFQPGADAELEEEEAEEEDEPINLNKDDPETLRKVQDLPEYPGGMTEFVKWLTKNLKYPPRALRNKIEGKVMVSFIVNTDGSLSEIKIEEPVNKDLDNEALRVAKLMPNWKPGRDHGKICRTKVAVPIVFEI